MIVNPDVKDVYIKTQNQRKTLRITSKKHEKKTIYWEAKEHLIPKYRLSEGPLNIEI